MVSGFVSYSLLYLIIEGDPERLTASSGSAFRSRLSERSARKRLRVRPRVRFINRMIIGHAKWRWPSLARRQTANLMSLCDPGVRIPLSTPFTSGYGFSFFEPSISELFVPDNSAVVGSPHDLRRLSLTSDSGELGLRQRPIPARRPAGARTPTEDRSTPVDSTRPDQR